MVALKELNSPEIIMNKHQLTAQLRTQLGRAVKTLRRSGNIPGNIFGNKIPSINISVNSKEFIHQYKQVGESTLLYLSVEKESSPRPTLVSEVVFHPVTGQILHVSFHQVNLKEKVTAPVPIQTSGESPADRDKLGIIVHLLHEIEIEALPTDMPEHILVDITTLSEVGQMIYVKDLALDTSKLSIVTDPESIIVKVEPLAKEEVVEVAAAVEAEAEKTPTTAETPTEESPKSE